MSQLFTRRRFLQRSIAGMTGLYLSSFTRYSQAQGNSSRPNIIFIFSDQQHWQANRYRNSFYTTPNLDRLADESLVFENMFCPTPQCSPTRSSILTGLYPSKTGVMGNVGNAGGEPLRMGTIGRELQKAGYYTGYFGKWHLGNEPVANAGWDEEWKQVGDPEVTRKGIRFLRERVGETQPFALFLSYHNPHDVYHIQPEEFYQLPSDKQEEITSIQLPESWDREKFQDKPSVQKQFMTEDQGTKLQGKPKELWQYYHYFYRMKTRLYDEQLGRILQILRDEGLYNNSIIIVTSDHGDMDTHHCMIFKGPFMYEHMVRIPLLIKPHSGLNSPGKGERTNSYTVSVDFAPTIRDLGGLAPRESDGISLTPLIYGQEPEQQREYVIGQYYGKQQWVNPIRMIRSSRWKYNIYRKYGEELYNLENDPHELNNLASVIEYAEQKQQLRQKLDDWIRANDDPFYSLPVTDQEGHQLPE